MTVDTLSTIVFIVIRLPDHYRDCETRDASPTPYGAAVRLPGGRWGPGRPHPVPWDWDAPAADGPWLRIAVSRVRASGTAAERRGILLVNPGGPGGSGLPYAVTKRAKLPESVWRAYDVIGFDPRGTGLSSPVGCGAMRACSTATIRVRIPSPSHRRRPRIR